MVSKTAFKDTIQEKPESDERLTQQLAHIKKWLFVASGMVAMFCLLAMSDMDISDTRTVPIFPFVWLLLWIIPLALAINLAMGPKWRHAPLHLRREFIIWPATLSWLTIGAFIFNEARVLILDPMITILLTALPGFGLWLLHRWILKKAYSDEDEIELFP